MRSGMIRLAALATVLISGVVSCTETQEVFCSGCIPRGEVVREHGPWGFGHRVFIDQFGRGVTERPGVFEKRPGEEMASREFRQPSETPRSLGREDGARGLAESHEGGFNPGKLGSPRAADSHAGGSHGGGSHSGGRRRR